MKVELLNVLDNATRQPVSGTVQRGVTLSYEVWVTFDQVGTFKVSHKVSKTLPGKPESGDWDCQVIVNVDARGLNKRRQLSQTYQLVPEGGSISLYARILTSHAPPNEILAEAPEVELTVAT